MRPEPMNGDNWSLVIDEPIEVQDFKKTTIILEERGEYMSN